MLQNTAQGRRRHRANAVGLLLAALWLVGCAPVPVRANAEDLKRFHGTNERISIDNYVGMIQFYERLLRNASDVAKP